MKKPIMPHSQNECAEEPTALSNEAAGISHRVSSDSNVVLSPLARTLCAISFLLAWIPGSIQVGACEGDPSDSLRVRWHFPISASMARCLTFKVDVEGRLWVSPSCGRISAEEDEVPGRFSRDSIIQAFSRRKSAEVAPIHEGFEAFRRIAKDMRVVGPVHISAQDGVTVVYRMAPPTDGWCMMTHARITSGDR